MTLEAKRGQYVVLALAIGCCVFYVYWIGNAKGSAAGFQSQDISKCSSCECGNRSAKETKPNVKVSEDVWSTQWPRVHLTNCSNIVFMDRGLNSPNQTNHKRYPRTGIISSPGHGNTWTRHLIQQATGLWTGSVYNDGALYKGGFKGEFENCVSNGTVAIKSHSIIHTQACPLDRIILVVRDVHHGILAEFNRQNGRSHVRSANAAIFKSPVWTTFVEEKVNSFSSGIVKWIAEYIPGNEKLRQDVNPFSITPYFWKNLLLVSYERLKEDPTKEAERIVEFLGLPVFRRHCVEENSQGQFKRSGSNIPIQCLYKSSGMRKAMEKGIQHLSADAVKAGAGNITSEFEFIDWKNLTNCPL